MNKKFFRVFLLFNVLLAFFCVGAVFLFPNEFAESANDFILTNEAELTDVENWFLIISGSLALLLGSASYIGMFLFKAWSRRVYISSYALIVPSYFLNGVYATGGIEKLTYDLSMALAGAIIVLIYYSPISYHFEPSKN
jgi:hypothetical protein